jgi:O-antigen/teichoic acid export membrane protein
MVSRRQTLTNFLSFLLAKAGAIAFFVIGVRYFLLGAGSAEYGAINLILVLYTYLWIADLGIGYAVNLRLGRQLSQSQSAAAAAGVYPTVAKALPLYLGIGVTLALAAFLVREPLAELLFRSERYSDLVGWTGLAAPFVMLSALSSAVLRAFDKVYLVNTTQLLLDAWRAGCLVALATTPEPALAVGVGLFAGTVGRAALDLALLCREIGWRWVVPRWSWPHLKADLLTGAPTMGSLLIFAVFYSADRVFAARVFSLGDVAIYSLAADLHTKAYFLLWAVNAALYQPLVARHALQQGGGGIAHLNAAGGALIALLYYVPLALLSTEIVTIWINAETAGPVAPVVWAMLPGSIAYLLASSLENAYLRTRGIVLGPMLVHAAMLIVLLVGLLPLASRHGLAGIGWAHSAANGVFLVGIAALVLRHRVRP